jgi:uncharacterized damage-inducible protein DinB
METTMEQNRSGYAKTEHTLAAPLLLEFREEVAITRRVLERVPGDKLTWKPHPKSMSLGQLAWHVATTPGNITRISQQASFEVSQANFVPPEPKSREEILEAYEQSVRAAETGLEGFNDELAMSSWRLLRNGNEISARPKINVVRTIMLNHWYHHRGQLSVYLRLLEIPVPVIYGRSADENPFG